MRMDNLIIQSIIEITRQRDLDALEYSLVVSLAEIVPVTAISIFKSQDENIIDNIEEIVRLSVLTDGDGEKIFKWSDEPREITIDEHLEQCLKTLTPVMHKTRSGTSRLLIPVSCENITVGALSLDSSEDISSYKDILENIITIYENYLIILNDSERDKLTGLFNRRTFDRKLDRLLQSQINKKEQYMSAGKLRERRHIELDACAWLVVLDFDNFKYVNDTYGHVYGDEVLLIFSQKMKKYFRNSDLLFRFGGDEFVIILEPVPFEMASHALEQFCKSIADHDFPLIGKITTSVGYAKITEKDYPPKILDLADKALYYAKENGRNCICNYETLLKEGKLSNPKQDGSIDLF